MLDFPWGPALLMLLPLLAGCSGQGPGKQETRPAPAERRFAEFDGKKVHYLDSGGDAPAVVLVHGWACDRRVWQRQVDALAARYRLIVIDLPGHGKSEQPLREHGFDLYADAIAEVLDHAGIDAAVLVGHSNGTPTVRQFYRRYPKRTKALVLVDGALRAMFDAEIARGFLDRFRGKDFRDQVAALIDGMPPMGLDEDGRGLIRTMALEQAQRTVLGGLEATLEPGIWNEDPIDVPLLVILAAQPAWTGEYEQFVRGLAPHVDYRVLRGVNHFIMLDRPEEFTTLLTGFLQGTASQGRPNS